MISAVLLQPPKGLAPPQTRLKAEVFCETDFFDVKKLAGMKFESLVFENLVLGVAKRERGGHCKKF